MSQPPNNPPQTWLQMQLCPCDHCQSFRAMLKALGVDDAPETRPIVAYPLAVFDLRMYGHGFGVVDLRKLYREPAIVQDGHPNSWRAVLSIRSSGQERVGLLLSNFPSQPLRWRSLALEPVGSIV